MLFQIQTNFLPSFVVLQLLSLVFVQLEIQLGNKGSRPIMHLVDVNGSVVSGVSYNADHLNNVLEAHNMSTETQYYWALPKEFLGNKVEISCLFYQSVLLRNLIVARIFNSLFTPALYFALKKKTNHDILDFHSVVC